MVNEGRKVSADQRVTAVSTAIAVLMAIEVPTGSADREDVENSVQALAALQARTVPNPTEARRIAAPRAEDQNFAAPKVAGRTLGDRRDEDRADLTPVLAVRDSIVRTRGSFRLAAANKVRTDGPTAVLKVKALGVVVPTATVRTTAPVAPANPVANRCRRSSILEFAPPLQVNKCSKSGRLDARKLRRTPSRCIALA